MDHQQNTENAGQENVATEVVEEAEEMFENDHQQNIENAGQENVATEVVEEAEEIFENGSNEAESSSDYETDDEQYFYEQFEDWDGLSDEVQSNAKRFLDENYTVGELQLAFNKYSADKGRRPTAGQFRKFILRSPGMPKKRKSLVDMIKSLEEKETEASELKMKLHDTRCFMGKQASVIHNYDQELRKSRECIDKMTVQYETVHDKNQQLLDANTHMLQTYMPLQRDCNLLLVKTKEKDQTIADLSKQINYQDDSIKSLTIQNKDQDKSNKSLKMENTKLQDKIVKQGEVNFDLMKDKKLLEEENKDMKVKYTDLKKMNVKQNIELEDVNIKLKKQKLVCDELKSELCETKSRLEIIEKELITKNCEINNIKSNQKEEHHEMKKIQAQLAELTEKLSSQNAVQENGWSACTIL